MLQLLRKYQRFLFLLVTAVVVVTFSFFGVDSGPTGSMVNPREEVYLSTAEGRSITRGEMEDMVLFLSTDAKDSLNSERVWGYNFLNDGVVRKDFLESGLALAIVENHREDISKELDERLAREKRYRPYRHPRAEFVNAEMAWNYFAPEIKEQLNVLRKQKEASSDEAFQARVKLYLAERDFPAAALRQALFFQQQQYEWLQNDPALNQADLSIFGYHTLQDWFGNSFLHLLSQVLINGAEKAKDMGYHVSDEEVQADLLRNALLAYRDRQGNPNVRVNSPGEFYHEQLRLMHMDEARALDVWRQVMLFRRLFNDVGNAALVDPLMYQQFNAYAKEGVAVQLYELPPHLRFRRFADLQRFETYVNAVAKKADGLSFPKEFRAADELRKSFPELVQKRYLLEVKHVDQAELQTKVGVRETWDWEVSDEGWALLKQEFRELGAADATTVDERFAALEVLDGQTRTRVDSFARKQIVEAKPQWIEDALDEAEPETKTLKLRLAGGQLLLKGMTDREKLMALLDEQDELEQYSQDQRHYYTIQVLDRSDELEVLSFAQAAFDGVLDELIDRDLQKHYEKVRDANPLVYKTTEGEWKALGDVKMEVAKDFFQATVKAVNEDYHNWRKLQPATQREKEGQQMSTDEDRAAVRRFISPMRQWFADLKGEKVAEDTLIAMSSAEAEQGELPPADRLEEQWKLVKRDHTVYRHGEQTLDTDTVFALEPGHWSNVYTTSLGNVLFYRLGEQVEQEASVAQQMDQGRELLSREARLYLMQNLLSGLDEDEVLKLDYLKRRQESFD